MVSSEGNMSLKNPLKNPVTPPGIDPGTVRLVAQRLNHYATPGPTNSYTRPKYVFHFLEILEFSISALRLHPCVQAPTRSNFGAS
jgi:hypothetical protein